MGRIAKFSWGRIAEKFFFSFLCILRRINAKNIIFSCLQYVFSFHLTLFCVINAFFVHFLAFFVFFCVALCLANYLAFFSKWFETINVKPKKEVLTPLFEHYKLLQVECPLAWPFWQHHAKSLLPGAKEFPFDL